MDPNEDSLREIDLKSKSLILTVLESCKKEAANNMLQIPLENFVDRASFYTGVDKDEILKLLGNKVFPKFPIDLKYQILIMEKIKECYNNQEMVTYDMLYTLLKSQSKERDISDVYYFTNVLIKLGYEYVKTQHGLVLMENPKIRFNRFRYIKKLIELRQAGKTIYYVDVRIFRENVMLPMQIGEAGLIQESDIVYFHAICRNGLKSMLSVSGTDYVDSFVKSMSQLVCDLIAPSSVIVMMENHLNQLISGEERNNKGISPYHTKNEMIIWLRENNIPCDNKMDKAVLFDLIERCNFIKNNKNIVNIIKLYGHELLCVAEPLLELFPTNILWRDINNTINPGEYEDQKKLKNYVTSQLASIPRSTWRNYQESVLTMETTLFALDTEIESLLDQYYSVQIS